MCKNCIKESEILNNKAQVKYLAELISTLEDRLNNLSYISVIKRFKPQRIEELIYKGFLKEKSG